MFDANRCLQKLPTGSKVHLGTELSQSCWAALIQGPSRPEKLPGIQSNPTRGKGASAGGRGGREEEGRGRNAKVGLNMKSVFKRGGASQGRPQTGIYER